MAISRTLRQLVIERDKFCCAYCQTTEDNCGQQMHVDHIYPESAGGPTVPHDLCAICMSCNSYKGVQTSAIDVLSGDKVSLFHPLEQKWAEHFAWSDDNAYILGLTPCGRVTVDALRMNHKVIIRARKRWAAAGWHPPIF